MANLGKPFFFSNKREQMRTLTPPIYSQQKLEKDCSRGQLEHHRYLITSEQQPHLMSKPCLSNLVSHYLESMDILWIFCYLNKFLYKNSKQIFLPDTLCIHQSPLLSKNKRSVHNLFGTDMQQPELECACIQAKTVEKSKVTSINGHVNTFDFPFFPPIFSALQ